VIKAYHRPGLKKEAVDLYHRPNTRSIFILGSSHFGSSKGIDVELIDLQDVRDQLSPSADETKILNCLEFANEFTRKEALVPLLPQALKRDLTENQRNQVPLSGLLYHANGQCITASVLMACDADVTLFMDGQRIKIDDWLLKRDNIGFEVCEKIDIPEAVNVTFEDISKTPFDYPQLVVALAQWKSGRTRLVVGASEMALPQLVFDGTEPGGIKEATRNACKHLFERSKEAAYYTEASLILLERLLAK